MAAALRRGPAVVAQQERGAMAVALQRGPAVPVQVERGATAAAPDAQEVDDLAFATAVSLA
jgi:hypothetical protein